MGFYRPKLTELFCTLPGIHSRSMSSNTSSSASMMSSASKKSAKVPASPSPVSEVPKVAKATKSKVSESKAEVAAPAAAPAAVAVAEPEAVEASSDGAVLLKNVEALQEQLNNLKSTVQSALAGLKTLSVQASRLVKKAERRGRRKAAVDGEPKKPCVFTIPAKISDELCAFLAKPKGTEMSRSDVTKSVMGYAKSHNLMEKQTIKADASLRKLLTLKENDVLTILNLQTYLSRHYVKAVPVAK